jgi:hypothetical protein
MGYFTQVGLCLATLYSTAVYTANCRLQVVFYGFKLGGLYKYGCN